MALLPTMAVRPREHASVDDGPTVDVMFEGAVLPARPDEPLMATLLAHGVDIASRSVKYHRPRGAFCLGGTCGQCWMRIGDVPNQAACTTPVHKGMVASRENAFPSADHDLFRAADLFFPHGLDHHRLGTTASPVVNVLIGGTARHLAGLGTLSAQEASPPPAIRRRTAEVVVIGAGPAGLSAALAAARSGVGVLLLEKRREVGGHINTGLFDDEPAFARLPAAYLAELEGTGASIWTKAYALGVYQLDGDRRELLVRVGRPEEHLVRVRPEVLILANGGYEQGALFGDNDLPGHYAARGIAKLMLRRRIEPGRRVVILDDQSGGETAWRLERGLAKRGLEVIRLVSAATDDAPKADGPKRSEALTGVAVERALGRSHVKGLEIVTRAQPDVRKKLRTDLVISALLPSPAYELAHQAGCLVEHRPERGGFPVWRAPRSAETSVRGVLAAGDVAGARTVREAIEDGELAGVTAALMLTGAPELQERRDMLALRRSSP